MEKIKIKWNSLFLSSSLSLSVLFNTGKKVECCVKIHHTAAKYDRNPLHDFILALKKIQVCCFLLKRVKKCPCDKSHTWLFKVQILPLLWVTLFNAKELKVVVEHTRSQALGLQGGHLGLEKHTKLKNYTSFVDVNLARIASLIFLSKLDELTLIL